jgi:hypothetical protein
MAKFINISERYGGQFNVTVADYKELNPNGKFEIHGDEIREYRSNNPGDYEVVARKR